ncbi:protein translocase subunit SecF [Luteimonas vadosa]|uniref:Protein-export membrane protein SecF n=1 Tax=Luteimonas vadosa TaxID=1165507 RepID=A0ABP9E850_9GAMM
MSIFPLTLIPSNSRINFMAARWVTLTLAVILAALSIGALATKGFNYAIDFTGGTVVELRFERPADVDGIRKRLDGAGLQGAQVQTFGSGSDILVRLRPDQEGTGNEVIARVAEQVRAAASTSDNAAVIQGREFVSAQVGKELATNAVYAILFVVIGILIYISFRFEWKFAVSAIVTTSLFDVLVVAGWFAISQREFDLTVLAGMLAVMGFSINDTIVVFDRVRENFRGMRADPITVLNASINQTLSRTIITSVVTFLALLALYLYGGGSLRGMAEAQMIGVVAGTLSSIFIACPLLTVGFLKVSKQDLMPKARDEAALARRP